MTEQKPAPVELRRHRDRNISPRKWSVKRMIPQNGVGLISGQGDPDTGAVIDWITSPRLMASLKASRKPNEIRSIVVDLINEHHCEKRSPFPDKPPMECVSDDEVRKAFYRRDADRQRSYDARYKAATRAMKAAVTSGAVGMLDGWLWLT